MPHVSKNKLDKKTEDNLIQTLELVLSKLTKDAEIKGFLLSLLSPTERLMLAKRLAIAMLLKENLPATHIAHTLHVTRDT
ncbi:MAG TPA: Trp family transcriptional regulator, partial [Xanthomonadales bacterium]|nr:Trp family transcriptional regulator [Xanthomonadales bacterium]